ncbi:phage tail sheath subtilisin-like domain-containing protein [Chromobacterium sp. S0633]|uniref:phage tail sheath subtilisin-like domain-containing protein n=1 Tax=Chromobacterium sp. S0633 TaxID=2957805 RepID=UPI00209FB076|nr:phage tail sheath subtilisin-like domain-containing protein [Chromobacterium sp. S0633]MCP1290933.1 phage tail sheath subtilisin-like domain-containing protein [Chromobacterium sp. S0633]
MTIPFKNIPANIRVPLFYAEVDNSRANTAQANQRALIIGQITAAGTGVANVPVISQGVSDAQTVGGQNSMLALMTAKYRQNDQFGEVWYLPLADNAGALAATGTITIGGAPTANGTLYLYVGGVRYAIPVLTTQTSAQIATSIANIIGADAACPVTAAAAGSVVTLTAVNKGPCGNDIDLRMNYQGPIGGEQLPAGVSVTIAQMSGGATAPDMTTALANLGDMPFDFIVCPFNDATSLNALQSLLNDQTGRWSYSKQLYGHVFAAYRGTLGAQTTLGTTRNNQHETIIGFNDSPTPNWLWAAALAGAAAVSLRADPATPLQTVAIQGVLAPPLQSRFVLSDRNTLLFDGISTFMVGQDGTVYIENLITSYQKNAFGNPDNSYLEVETLFTLMYVLRFMRTIVTSKYARMKLAANGTRFAAGSNIVTPDIIRGDLIAAYRELEYQGLVQNGDAFKQGLIVQQDSNNPNRVNVLWPGILINQLRIFALLAQFRLQ